MSNNSYVTIEGGEIGRAQVVQAEAAGVLPSVHINPTLLKPSTDQGPQIILQGSILGQMEAVDYHDFKSSKGFIPRPLGRSMLLMIPRCLRRGSSFEIRIPKSLRGVSPYGPQAETNLNALALGEEEVTHLGLNVPKTKRILFLIASILTGFSVSGTGIIGFVGLIVPHFMRMFAGLDRRILFISSFLAGACFLIICDTLACTVITPLELSEGVITGIIGGVVFIYALSKKQVLLRKMHSFK